MRLFLLAISACMPFMAHAGEKMLGFDYERFDQFRCEPENFTVDNECTVVPPDEEMRIGGIRINALACKGPLDTARVKRGDFLLAIDGVKVMGMTVPAFEELLRIVAQRPSSNWLIARISESGHRELFETSVAPAEMRGDEDYESCGIPDPEA